MRNPSTNATFTLPGSATSAKQKKVKDPVKVLQKHFEKEVSRNITEQRELLKNFLWDMDAGDMTENLLKLQHDWAVGERSVGSELPPATAFGVSEMMGTVAHVIKFLNDARDSLHQYEKLVAQMEAERMKQEIYEMSLELAETRRKVSQPEPKRKAA